MLTNHHSTSFGALLKTFRTRRSLTQQAVANALGIHRRTLGRWEQGDYLPESKAVVLELARHLKLDEQEARQFLEASLTGSAPYWYVPLPRNPYFTGRERLLSALHTQLDVAQAMVLSQSSALYGLGGIGKTQIALEYAYRHALDYSAVFWIRAETTEHILSSYWQIAETLHLPECHEKDHEALVMAVNRWLATHSRWLLIWDNLEDLDLLDRFLPPFRQGVLLLTTRRHIVGTHAQSINLEPLGREEGVLFLLRRAKMLNLQASLLQMRHFAGQRSAAYAAAAELVTLLGGLPLALDQAGAYLEATHCGLPAYLELFRTHCMALLEQRGEGSRDHPASVATTFRLAIAAMTQRCQVALDVLYVCARLQPEELPEEIFLQGGPHLGAALEAACRDPLSWNHVVSIACSYALLSRQPATQTFSMHRLVQAVLVAGMTQADSETWEKRIVEALDAVFPEIESESTDAVRRQSKRLLPQALWCLWHSGQVSDTLPFASLAHKTARTLSECGRYTEAEPLLQQALRIREQLLGSEHPDVALSLCWLATLSRERGNYIEAEPLFQQALGILSKHRAPGHSDIALVLNNLALLYWEQGRYAEAEPLLQQALSIWERTTGVPSLRVIYALNNLALLYMSQSRYTEAEPLLQQGATLLEQRPGSSSHLGASTLNNLALLSWKQGRYAEAERLWVRVLHVWEQTMGRKHPRTARVLSNLAATYWKRGKLVQAKALFQRAIGIWEQTKGADHPQVAFALEDLAGLYKDQGDEQEAEALLLRTLHIREQALGPHHPETARTLHDLAQFRQQQGKLSEACSLAERALSIRVRVLGNAHPQTLATRALRVQLGEAQAPAEEERCSQEQIVLQSHSIRKVEEENNGPRPIQTAFTLSIEGTDSFEAFLGACCDLHPRAWCRSADLWQAYRRWTADQQERYPLSRGVFRQRLKAHGCYAGRTMSARIWRGIALVKPDMTAHDGT